MVDRSFGKASREHSGIASHLYWPKGMTNSSAHTYWLALKHKLLSPLIFSSSIAWEVVRPLTRRIQAGFGVAAILVTSFWWPTKPFDPSAESQMASDEHLLKLQPDLHPLQLAGSLRCAKSSFESTVTPRQ